MQTIKEPLKVEQINKFAKENPAGLVHTAEEYFGKQIENAVNYILSKKVNSKVILISGPSCSGKTTTSKFITKGLLKKGHHCDRISLDNFYLGTNFVPVLEDGSKDFESIKGLNIKAIKKSLYEIIYTGKTEIPLYDFEKMGPAEHGLELDLHKDGYLVVEGLHAMNLEILEGLPKDKFVKIYCDIKGGIYNQFEEFFSVDYIRVTRRIVRDYNYRFTSALETLAMWKNVRRGEKMYVKPQEKYADVVINSLHEYEPCVFRDKILELLEDEVLDEPMQGCVEAIKRFVPISNQLVPKNSLLREFI